MSYTALDYPYSSQRMAVYAQKGMVATSQPLAAQAGLDILKRGGNAIDAAVATAACLTVVEPTSNGVGGDAFALVWVKDQLHGLNASGTAPQALSLEVFEQLGLKEVPHHGFVPVTVPGAPSAWAALNKRFGRLPLKEVLQPAITYAREGFPVSPVVARNWRLAYLEYREKLRDSQHQEWFNVFAPDDKTPDAGEIWSSPNLAQTLEAIAESDACDFYQGELAERIDKFSREHGGYLRKSDLEGYQPLWVDPICIDYRGYSVWEIPPNGHGMVALMALNILSGLEFTVKDYVDTYHKQIEALKLAYADGLRYIAAPESMEVTVEDLLSPDYAKVRRALIGEEAITPPPGEPLKGGTVYLATADGEGNMVSFIQSNYMGFGSGLVVPGTGIALHNRGCNFSLDPKHPNCLAPGKRPYHTIIPGFLTKGKQAVGPFGVMGAFMQPQGQLQVVMNMVDFGLNPQAALDAPRWCWSHGKHVDIEPIFPQAIAESLCRRGHVINRTIDPTIFGRGQIIRRLPNGTLEGGTDPRADGVVAAW